MPATPLSEQQIAAALSRLDGWSIDDGSLARTLTFDGFPAALAFMVRVGFVAEQQGHHPDWTNVYNRVTVRLNTHDAGGAVTQKDVDLAAAIDGLV